MDPDERFEMNERGRADAAHEPIYCECGQTLCNRTIDEYDPIILDGRFFSDYCASDLVFLRMEELIEGVAKKTKQLGNRCIICGKIGNDVFLCAACNEFVCNDCYEDEIKLSKY